MRSFRLPYVLFALGLFVIVLGGAAIRTLQLDWYANHKVLNMRIGHIDWIRYGLKRGILYVKQQLFYDDKPGLDQVRLYIPRRSQEALMDNPPDSTKIWQPAIMAYPDRSLERINVRYRGDSSRNWLYQKKSLRIKTRKKRLLGTRRVLNYVVPQAPDQMMEYLGYMAARDTGVLAPPARLVEVFVNDEPYGIFVEYDKIDELFLRNSGQMPVNMYKGEQIHVERSEDTELDLFNNPALWRKIAVGNDLPPEDLSDLTHFLATLRDAATNDDVYGRLKRVAPFSEWARLAAYQILTQNVHNDGFHNQRLFVDPWRGEVRPVINDPFFIPENPEPVVRRFRLNQSGDGTIPPGELEIDSQSLLRLYNRDPAFILEKYRLLYDFVIKDRLLERVVGRVRDFTDRLLVSAERDGDLWQHETWPGFPFTSPADKLRGKLSESTARIEKFETWLIAQLKAAPTVRWNTSDGRFVFDINTFIPMDGLTLRLAAGAPVPTRIAWDSDGDGRLGPSDVTIPITAKNGGLSLDAAWMANRPAIGLDTYRRTGDYPIVINQSRETRFVLVADVALNVVAVTGRNALTSKSLDLGRGAVDGAWPSRRNRPVTPPKQPPMQIWRGGMTFAGTAFIDYPVRIEAGACIRMKPGARLIFRNRVVIAGTASDPVVVTSAQAGKPFGLIALQGPGTAGSSLRYLHMDGGTGGRVDNVQYTATLNIHNTRDIELSGLRLRNNSAYDDMLHIVYTDNILINKIQIDGAFADAVDIDISSNVRFKGGVIRGAGNDGIDLMSSTAVIEGMILAGNKDKGISVGEATDVLIKETRLEGNVIGIESKDGSLARVEDVDFVGNKIQINAYKKNWQYGTGGTMEVSGSTFTGGGNIIKAGKNSAIRVTGSRMAPLVQPGKRVVFENVVAVPGGQGAVK